MKNLSDKQQLIYDQIRSLKEKYPMVNPTAIQLAKLFNMSKQAMNGHLMNMEIKGYIKRQRGVEITK